MHRLPRFKRVPHVRKIYLTERDYEIIRLTHRYRFLRSTHILALVPGSRQQVLRHLQLLFHHGYLERPRAQIEYYGKGGPQAIVYGIGNKGAKVLQEKLGIQSTHLRWTEKNQDIRKPFLAHALALSDIMVALELGARARPDITLTWHDEFQDGSNQSRPWKWRVRLNSKTTLGLIPDRVFSIDRTNADGKINRCFFFLEADRGTMPVIRKNLLRTSFYRKLLAYEATWKSNLHRDFFGIDRFRVFTVTTGETRAIAMLDACAKLKSGHRLFLFSDHKSFSSDSDVFTSPCLSGKPGEMTAILPETANSRAFEGKHTGDTIDRGAVHSGSAEFQTINQRICMTSVTLYYRNEKNDKVYQAAIEPRGNLFAVTFAYGRRRKSLQTGIKTHDPVDLPTAQKVFDKLLSEKKAKGYTPGENGTPYEHTEDAGTFTGILPQLLNAITAEEALALIKDPDWCMQEKKDGRRCLIRKCGTVIQGINRRGLLCSLPSSLLRELSDFQIDFVIDGEIIGETFHVFDLLQCGDRNWRALPYQDRLDALDALLSDERNLFIRKIETFRVERTKLDQFEELQRHREEGVVFKLLSGPYLPGRPNSGGPSLKYKFTASASFIVAKHNDSRSVGLKLFREKNICGNVTIPPNRRVPKVGAVVEVRYLYAFARGSLCQPVYIGERDDLDPSACLIGQLKFKREEADDDGE